MPGEGDEDSDEEGQDDSIQNDSVINREDREKKVAKRSITATPSGQYVDGKSMFAFDPSKFTGI